MSYLNVQLLMSWRVSYRTLECQNQHLLIWLMVLSGHV